MPRIRLIDPITDKELFDSDDPIIEQLDPERDHIVAGPGWKLQTPEQMETEISRPAMKDCPTCLGKGTIDLPSTGVIGHRCPTCHGNPEEKKGKYDA
jgi:hypothetical protein